MVIGFAVFGLIANIPDARIPGWGHYKYYISHSIFVTGALVAVALLGLWFVGRPEGVADPQTCAHRWRGGVVQSFPAGFDVQPRSWYTNTLACFVGIACAAGTVVFPAELFRYAYEPADAWSYWN